MAAAACTTLPREAAVRREIQAQIDASIEADRRKDVAVALDQSRALDEALRRAGVESTLIVFPGEGHFGVAPGRPVAAKFTEPMNAFLDRHLR